MYYSNISNEELQYFHDYKVNNFSIKLSDILSEENGVFNNSLFKIEEVIEDTIYKIYPLFYTNKITSTNSNDKIIENKCIICQKKEKETFITFIKDESEDTVDYANYLSYYDINDSLTENEFNAIITLFRRNTVHTDNISLKEEQITGEYGKYTFDLNSTTIVDDGILITDETITNLGTVKLENAVFNNSKYTLQLTVYHMTDINVCEVSDNNIVKEVLTVELKKDDYVTIPFNSLNYNYIISFDAKIVITHDKPIIHYYGGDMKLSASNYTVLQGQPIELSSQLLYKDYEEYKQNGITVYFYKEE